MRGKHALGKVVGKFVRFFFESTKFWEFLLFSEGHQKDAMLSFLSDLCRASVTPQIKTDVVFVSQHPLKVFHVALLVWMANYLFLSSMSVFSFFTLPTSFLEFVRLRA